jgi:DNA mismatch repair protein MutS2
MVTAFVDRCAADGMAKCRIIHGSGTGALRQAVHDTLSRLQQVESFEPAPREQGGDGATLVALG